MLKFLFSLCILLFPINVIAASIATISDGKIKFAKCQIDGKVFWNNEDVSDYELNFPSSTVIDISPSELEVAISTNATFSSLSEFEECKTKSGLFKKLVELKSDYDVAVLTGNKPRKMAYEKLLEVYDSIE